MEITKKRCQKLISAGANVILCTKGIDEFALKYFVESKAIAVRRVSKQDLRRIAKSTNATIVTTFADDNGDEKVDPFCLGETECVSEEKIGDNEFILFKKSKVSLSQTIIIRGANEYMLDEVERSMNDAIQAVKRVLESNSVVVGGGCVETSVGIFLEDFSRTIGSREQLAIQEFAEALYIIPKTLALNAAKDALDLIAKLRTFHYASQNSDNAERQQWKNCGLDLIKGTIRNNYTAGLFEPSISKLKSLK
jgi:T-complex protein 1 subunit alpha